MNSSNLWKIHSKMNMNGKRRFHGIQHVWHEWMFNKPLRTSKRHLLTIVFRPKMNTRLAAELICSDGCFSFGFAAVRMRICYMKKVRKCSVLMGDAFQQNKSICIAISCFFELASSGNATFYSLKIEFDALISEWILIQIQNDVFGTPSCIKNCWKM